MGLIDTEVEITLNSKNYKYYEGLGYKIPRYKNKNGDNVVKRGTKIIIKIEDLTRYSMVNVNVKCDSCGNIKPVKYEDYLKCVKDYNLYYCSKCSRHRMFISFEKWCLNNNQEHLLELFDYDLNKLNPSEISYGTEDKYYFKCSLGIHESELQMIKSITKGLATVRCNQCNSLGQWMIDNLGKNSIEKYWSKKNKISPFEVSRCSSIRKYYFICQEDLVHEDYLCLPMNFFKGSRCPLCNTSKGEIFIKNYLDKYKITYEYQKEFNGLIGVNNGNLSYDFYLSKYNLLLEFQGIQHEKPIDFKGKGRKHAKEQFKIQQIHDNLKQKYAKDNNIRLLEIWYYDFDNIETILEKEIANLKG